MGLCVGPDDMNLGLRGLRTLAVRLRQHQQSGLTVARWFEQRPEVLKVLHPALPGDPGHAIWKRDFTGASGLFSDRAQAGAREGGAGLPQRALALRHGRILGRLREPRHSVRREAIAGPRRNWSRVDPRSASTSGLRTWATSSPISSAASPRWPRRDSFADHDQTFRHRDDGCARAVARDPSRSRCPASR